MITNLEEGEVKDAGFPDLYYKRWPVETRYRQLKQKFEPGNFSGRLVDTIKQDFYATVTVANMLAAACGKRTGRSGRNRLIREGSTPTG
jgi:hypothetical protein